MIEELDNWNELRWKWDEIWNKKEIWNYGHKVRSKFSKHMMIIDDNDYSNPYDKSNDNKKTKRINNNIIKSTTNVGVSKNNNNRNYKNVNNNHNDNNSNNNNQ